VQRIPVIVNPCARRPGTAFQPPTAAPPPPGLPLRNHHTLGLKLPERSVQLLFQIDEVGQLPLHLRVLELELMDLRRLGDVRALLPLDFIQEHRCEFFVMYALDLA
jgi:hypothetical protein